MKMYYQLIDAHLLDKTEVNKESAISAMFILWRLGVANVNMMDDIKKAIDERYSNLNNKTQQS